MLSGDSYIIGSHIQKVKSVMYIFMGCFFFSDGLILRSVLCLVVTGLFLRGQGPVKLLRKDCGKEKLAVVHFAETCMCSVVCKKTNGPFKHQKGPGLQKRIDGLEQNSPNQQNDRCSTQPKRSERRARHSTKLARNGSKDAWSGNVRVKCETLDLLFRVELQGIY